MICSFAVFRLACCSLSFDLRSLITLVSSNYSYIHVASCSTTILYYSYVTVSYKLYCSIYRSRKLRCYSFNVCHYCPGYTEVWFHFFSISMLSLYNTRYKGLTLHLTMLMYMHIQTCSTGHLC